MNRINLQEEFVKELQEKIPYRTELASKISNILDLEKESVLRRLNGRVQFSAQEIGILAKEFCISLDALINRKSNYQWFPLILESPNGVESMDVLYDYIDETLDNHLDVAQGDIEFGAVLNSIPLEFFVHHPYLMKFMFFKWGNYFVGTDEFNNFAEWKISDRVSEYKDKAEKILTQSRHSLYIWDESLIWTMVNEIEYLYKMEIINDEDLENVKKDLKESLVNLEKYISGSYKPEKSSQSLSFYVSNANLGVSAQYLASDKKKAYNFKTNFTFVSSETNTNQYESVKNWIDSFKNISILISGSGPVDRRLFFLKQHKIIDDFLKTDK